tara:strand:+ start:10366 stop:10737 length:372 start_codon:yes stop_codon:yes gene_type:complete
VSEDSKIILPDKEEEYVGFETYQTVGVRAVMVIHINSLGDEEGISYHAFNEDTKKEYRHSPVDSIFTLKNEERWKKKPSLQVYAMCDGKCLGIAWLDGPARIYPSVQWFGKTLEEIKEMEGYK